MNISDNNSVVARCLTMLKSLTVHTFTPCSDTPPIFGFLVPFLPPNPSQNPNIFIDCMANSSSDHDESIQAALMEFHKSIGELELVRYWQDIERRSSLVDRTGPFLNVSLRIYLLIRSDGYTGNHRTSDNAFAISLFDRLRSTRAVSLSVKVT